MSKTVRYEMDLNNPPPLTDAQHAEINALAARPDSEIDYSDIPPLDEAFWQNAVRNPFYKPTKTAKTLRIDSDVLAWFMRKGKGYQTQINAVLRQAMLRSMTGKLDQQAP